MKTCTVEDCDKPVKAKQYCAMHHQRWLRHGDPAAVKVRRASDLPAFCQWVNCSRKVLSKGLCAKHYYIKRMQTTGQ
ncbi:hypothetical protein FHS18_004279 [Paenibacillus phyllosphaerae]|uniref:Uncharacterized protein n=1 Tax=Paenibacillus phyllosphaerae TaxID=274593 RepID=A0A7W5B0N1_9BACL|nr:hypothetical protein [Paenibacillus phyllosphaerae]MBB3112193.1 hypothetical protein [Paenibacillus phyllosphaerae]